jgi:RTX calcium-binding nonapeptide repeat (4 copies)
VRAGLSAICVLCVVASPVAAEKKAGPRCGGKVAKTGKQLSQVWAGGAKDNAFIAFAGDDYLIGAKGDDSLCGGGGADAVFGGKGNDFVSGNEGDDFLFGGAGDDAIHGGPGDDFISGGTGHDRCDGGGGNDVIRECEVVTRGPASKDADPGAEPPEPAPSPALPATTTTVNVAVNDLKRLAHIWGTTVPHAGPDTVYVVIQHKTPAGEWARVDGGCFGFGADGRFEHTFALAPANNYRVQARYRDPACPGAQYEGSSSSWTYFDVKASARAAAAGRDVGPSLCAAVQSRGSGVLEGGPAADVLAGAAGPQYVLGGAGDDTLCGGGGPDVLSGGDGNDRLDGEGGDDTLFGGAGDDVLRASPDPAFPCAKGCLPNSNTLYGGDGNDTLYGSHGPDVLIGGPGNNDICHLGGHPRGSRDKHPGCEHVLP